MKINTTSILIATLVIVTGAYWYFFNQTSSQPPLTEVSVMEGDSQAKFQSLVIQLQDISFNTQIFSDPKFTALVDIKTPIVSELSGRIDPFAPIPGVTAQ